MLHKYQINWKLFTSASLVTKTTTDQNTFNLIYVKTCINTKIKHVKYNKINFHLDCYSLLLVKYTGRFSWIYIILCRFLNHYFMKEKATNLFLIGNFQQTMFECRKWLECRSIMLIAKKFWLVKSVPWYHPEQHENWQEN